MEPDRPPVSTPAFWEGLYAAGHDGWDLGEPAPPLAGWLANGGKFEPAAGSTADGGSAGAISEPPQVKIAVPGAGRGHDARLLARHGYHVTAFDFAEPAADEARRLAAAEGVAVTVEARDVFTLARDHAGAFDAVWEYTCFCAIDPARRREYVEVLHAILKAGGILLACFYPLRDGTDGPPFPVSREAVDRVLAGRFAVLEAGPPARSAERRRGLEWLVRARREPAGPVGASDR
jgi:SAM-dependent methyltransferase